MTCFAGVTPHMPYDEGRRHACIVRFRVVITNLEKFFETELTNQ